MLDPFLYIGLPYIAIIVAIVGCYRRAKLSKFSMSARSSQFLEDKQLLWGSAPWHIGILVVLLGHLVAFLLPSVWSAILSVPAAVFIIETIGVACSILALVGLGTLIYRRLTSARIQAVTTTADLLVVALLFLQVLLGVLTATHFRYGAAWSTGTVVPYVWGILTLRPDMTYVTDFPMLFKLHLIGAWLFILLLPFTRLMHILAVPFQYLFRAPQLVIWNTTRRRRHAVAATARADSRREFLKGAVGVTGATGLLAIGVSSKAVNFIKGASSDSEAESALLEKKLKRLELTAEERRYELERQRNTMILVAPYTELDAAKGKYFIDYAMAPGLAFKGKDGMPIVISAKCTHLGCTVSSTLDGEGRVMCPCHISYFDITTGKPNEGAPAKAPLPRIGWALVDGAGKVVASSAPGHAPEAPPTPELLARCSLYITKPGKANA